MVNGDARILVSCAYDVPSGTAVRCSVDKFDRGGYGVSLVFGDGATQGEIVIGMPETLLGVVLAQLKATVKEIREARREVGAEVPECLPGI